MARSTAETAQNEFASVVANTRHRGLRFGVLFIGDAVTHSAPLRADLPLATDLQLACTGRFGSLQVAAAARVDIECAVGVNLATQDLPMLHAQAARLTALRPLANVPAAPGGTQELGVNHTALIK